MVSMSEELKKLKKDLAIDEYLKLIKEDNLLNNSYISLAQYMYFLEKQLQQAEEVIEESREFINKTQYDPELKNKVYGINYGGTIKLLDILNKYKKEESE